MKKIYLDGNVYPELINDSGKFKLIKEQIEKKYYVVSPSPVLLDEFALEIRDSDRFSCKINGRCP